MGKVGLVEIRGVLDRITFKSEENGFVVARLAGGSRQDKVTVVGTLAEVPVGSTLKLTGSWVQDKRHGRQFSVETYEIIKPNTVNGIERYLGSGLIKGVGPKSASRIVNAFGLATLDVLDREPERLNEVEGLGAKRVELIKKAWAEQKEIHQIMIFLQGHGISASYAIKIFRAYGAAALKIVQDNPYRLSEDIWGIGFKIADDIAGALGLPSTDPRRGRAGLLYVLNEKAGDGHCYLAMEPLLEQVATLLGQDREALRRELPGLVLDEKIVVDEEAVYLAPLFFAERGVAAGFLRLNVSEPLIPKIDPVTTVEEARKLMGLDFAPEQAEAIRMALSHRLSVITGGPGTGKSTILKALITICRQYEIKVKLAAPTGRAAKRLAEATGRNASTIHRLLEYDQSLRGFKRHNDNPLEADLVVIDEASMLDVVLANSLVKSVAVGASLLLVGDADQLPSVGPGNVLKDVIESDAVPLTVLTRIFRQGQGSLISVNAQLIHQGKELELLPDYRGEKDFYYISRENPDEIEKEVVSLCGGRLSAKYGFDPFKDIQVLTPMRKGVIGVDNLNLRLQETVNHAGQEVESGVKGLKTGDKVMQIRNNYDKDVFNGDLGFVRSYDTDEQALIIDFDGRLVPYEQAGLAEIELAYAVTVHKSQGSEFSCVIVPLHTTHYPLLARNLLYTAVTRGKKLVVVVGSRKALTTAIRNNRVMQRNTGLQRRLADGRL